MMMKCPRWVNVIKFIAGVALITIAASALVLSLFAPVTFRTIVNFFTDSSSSSSPVVVDDPLPALLVDYPLTSGTSSSCVTYRNTLLPTGQVQPGWTNVCPDYPGIAVPNTPLTAGYTWTMLVQINAARLTGVSTIIGSDTTGLPFSIAVDLSNHRIVWSHASVTLISSTPSDSTIQPGSYMHIATSFNDSSGLAVLYVNGARVAAVLDTTSYWTEGLRASPVIGPGWTGTLLHVQCREGALTGDQVRIVYNNDLGASPPLVATSMPWGQWGTTPVRGVNSFDSYGYWVDETSVMASIDYMAAHLLQYGYNLYTIDYFWYQDVVSTGILLDAFGRPQPDPNRFPSSTGGKGFTGLANYAHSKGIFFGIHTMRGIPSSASGYPIYGYNGTTTDQIIDANNPCPWDSPPTRTAFSSVLMTTPAGQAYYNSLYGQYAQWGVDFVKEDCVFANYVPDQIDATHLAIINSGRPMLLSLSPGAVTVTTQMCATVQPWVNMYRVTADFWDAEYTGGGWPSVQVAFQAAARFYAQIGATNGHLGLPSFLDLDMLPMGSLFAGGPMGGMRSAQWTNDQLQSIVTLWVMVRSPLIYGGSLVDDSTLPRSLLTNPDALLVHNSSLNNAPVSIPNAVVWRATVPLVGVYFSVHNSDGSNALPAVTVPMSILGLSGSSCLVRDVWQGIITQTASTSFVTPSFRPCASGFYLAFNCR